MYKLRIYKMSGWIDHEEEFNTKEEMNMRYKELFRIELGSLNPTKWKLVDGEWQRIRD